MTRLECKRCRRIKSVAEFNVDASTPTGYQRKCRDCQKEINDKYRKKCGHAPRYDPESGIRRIHVTLPLDMLLTIDDLAAQLQISRSEWIRNALQKALTETMT